MQVQCNNELDYFLGLLQEEASEIITEISKVKRFGLTERQNDNVPNNIERVQNEVKDLLCICRILEEKFDFDLGVTKSDDQHESSKREKLAFYSDYSKSLGLLKEE